MKWVILRFQLNHQFFFSGHQINGIFIMFWYLSNQQGTKQKNKSGQFCFHVLFGRILKAIRRIQPILIWTISKDIRVSILTRQL